MTFADFAAHFAANQSQYADLAWDDPHELSAAELRAVRGSLQAFQRGESSEGHHLHAQAKAWGNADYLTAIRLFIKEEQTHAAVLGRFLDQQRIPRLGRHWLDGIFRRLRRRLSLEHTLRVLLVAEVTAAVYYRALYRATFSGLLQQLCRRIVLDEAVHLEFQCLALHTLAGGRRGVGAWLRRQAYRALMAGTTVAVYVACRRTLRAGGYGLLAFGRAIAAEWVRTEQLQRGLLATGPGAAAEGRGPARAAAAGPVGAWQWPTVSARAAP